MELQSHAEEWGERGRKGGGGRGGGDRVSGDKSPFDDCQKKEQTDSPTESESRVWGDVIFLIRWASRSP